MNATWQGFTDRVTAEFGKVAMVDVRPLVTAAEDPLPTTELSNRHSKLQRTKAAEIERMTRAKWRQAAKDVPVAILAGGLGYGIGRTLTELIGKHPRWQSAKVTLSPIRSMAASRRRSTIPMCRPRCSPNRSSAWSD